MSGPIRAATVIAGMPLLFQSASFGPACHFHYPTTPWSTVTTGNGLCTRIWTKKERKTWRCILSWICVTALWSGSWTNRWGQSWLGSRLKSWWIAVIVWLQCASISWGAKSKQTKGDDRYARLDGGGHRKLTWYIWCVEIIQWFLTWSTWWNSLNPNFQLKCKGPAVLFF